jgi:hypothetical protein
LHDKRWAAGGTRADFHYSSFVHIFNISFLIRITMLAERITCHHSGNPFGTLLLFNDYFMQKSFIAIILCLAFMVSCSKSDVSPTNAVVGTWIFTNQFTNSFAYPSGLTSPFPVANTSWSTTVDSIKITFDDNGNYTFWNFHLPVDKGTYSIAQDSFIIIKPDTADFVRFNYSLPVLTTGTGIPPVVVYSPYSNFHFSSDTILFNKSTNNNIVFSGVWLTKADNPIIPSNDTLILNQSLNYFKRG